MKYIFILPVYFVKSVVLCIIARPFTVSPDLSEFYQNFYKDK